MKVPESIYIQPDAQDGWFMVNNPNNTLVKYTRTDTLEVKEVDLEKYYQDFLQKEWFGKNCNRTISEMMAFTAKHFFELGLKAQKGK